MRAWALLTLIALLATPAAGEALRVENTLTGRVFELPLGPTQRFSIVYRHSIYDVPVVEEFAIEGERIVLTAVSSPSAAAREYFGITAPGERHLLKRRMDAIYLRVAMGEAPRLVLRDRQIPLGDFGAPGDRLRLSAVVTCTLAG
jgi:hypothetical protein